MELTNGLIYSESISAALSAHIGKSPADDLVNGLCKESIHQKVSLKEVVINNKFISNHLSKSQIEELFKPDKSIGLCHEFIDRVVVSEK